MTSYIYSAMWTWPLLSVSLDSILQEWLAQIKGMGQSSRQGLGYLLSRNQYYMGGMLPGFNCQLDTAWTHLEGAS